MFRSAKTILLEVFFHVFHKIEQTSDSVPFRSIRQSSVKGNTDQPFVFKDTHREKALSNKTTAFTTSMNMDIWVVGTSHQLFIRGS